MPMDICPDCGQERTAGLCPRCLLHLGIDGLDRDRVRDNGIDQPPKPGSVLDTIAATIGGVPRLLLRDTDPGEIPSPIVRPVPGNDTTLRYRIDGEIARGGMGAILKGRDPDLGRDVAIKVLHEKLHAKPDMVRRFVEEAQIGGQLQHPGVVPVYELGTFADKRPFFSMKLVKGETLADLLAARSTPDDELPRFLSIFEAIAQTMAYSHTRGVIHRDLKPSNVMVGSFGEVQVMDWGLAKVLARGGAGNDAKAGKEKPPESPIATARSLADTDHSHAGSVMGTPSYMAPEQARGETDLIDERTDVFALGSILCEILTGAPVFTGHTSDEIISKAEKGDTVEALARLGSCGAEPDLIALATACITVDPAGRPRHAKVVADRTTTYLAGVQERLHSAKRERAVAVVRAGEERKRRKAQLALAAAVTGLLLSGGAFAWWRNDQARDTRERGARNAEAMVALLGQAEEALRRGDAARAALALDAARKRSAERGAHEQVERLEGLAADLILLRNLDVIDQHRWTRDGNGYLTPQDAARRVREVLRPFGADPDAAPADEVAARVSASTVREPIVSALHILFATERSAGAQAVLRRADADPYRDAVRDALLAGDGARVREFSEKETAPDQPPGFIAFLCSSGALGIERRRELLEAAVNRRPGNLSLLMTLGNTYPIDQRASADERLRWFQAAAAAAPANTAALTCLGNALEDKGEVDKAIACHEKAVALDPEAPLYRTNLGVALASKGRLDAAVECFEKAIALDPKHALGHYNLGLALDLKQSPLDKVFACYTKAVELDPTHAETHCNLAQVLARQGRFADSLTAFKRGHELGAQRPGWPYPSADWVRQAEAKAVLEARLPAFLEGEFQPVSSTERLGLVDVAQAKMLHRTATAMYAAAFEADPRLGDDRQAQHRYNAACAAALAAAGRGKDDPTPDDDARAKLRALALGWLKTELTAWKKVALIIEPGNKELVAKTLTHWMKDADLVAVRDEKELAKLPEAEREVWKKLWADVTALLKRVEKPTS